MINAQIANTRVLTIGDKLPVLTITQIVNSKSPTISLPQFKGKLLILNFISTACAGCIKSLPGIDSLQTQFKNNMQVILVTSQKKAAIQNFLLNNKAGKSLTLPVITADTVLKSFFPHEYISHLVWISPGGTVKAITEAEYLTAANIGEALQNHSLNWPVKNDAGGLNIATPFLQLNAQNIPPGCNPANLFYSAFYKHMPGMIKGMYHFTDSSKGTIKTLLVNQSIPDIYRRLFNYTSLPLSSVILQVPQTGFFVYSNQSFRAGWELYNTFSYESILPYYLPPQQRLQQALSDINRYTQTNAYITDTLINGFVLKDTNTAALPLLYKRPAGDSVMSMSGLLYTLNNNYGLPPVTDGRINRQQAWLLIDRTAIANMPALNKQLLPYGLVFQSQLQKIQALVISQTGNYPFIHSPKLYAK